MNRLAKCLGDLVDGGHLSRQQAEEALRGVKRAQAVNAERMSMPEAERLAVDEVLKTKAAQARKKKFQAGRQAMAQREILAHAAEYRGSKASSFLSELSRDPSDRTAWRDLETEASSIFRSLNSMAAGFYEKYAPKLGGRSRDIDSQRALVGEMFGRDTGDAAAKASAKSLRDTFEYARHWFNSEGGDIGKLENYHLPQRHSQLLIRHADVDGLRVHADEVLGRHHPDTAFNAWADFTDEIGIQIFDDARAPLTGLERRTVLRDVWETLSTDGANKLVPGASGGRTSNIVAKRSAERVLHFPSDDAWWKYHERFGGGVDLHSLIGEHLAGMARDIAALRKLGPNPAATVRWMSDTAKKDAPGSGWLIQRTWDELAGNSEVAYGWRRYLYKTMQGGRNLLRSAQMGSAVLDGLQDMALVRTAAAHNGIDSANVLGRYLKLMNPLDATDREIARHTVLISDIVMRNMSANRFTEEELGRGITGKLANLTFTASGLNRHTDMLSAAFEMETLAQLSRDAGKSLAELDPPFRDFLERAGLNDRLWDMARKSEKVGPGGAKILDPLEMIRSGDGALREAGMSLQVAILRERGAALTQPDATTRAVLNLGTKSNTLAGELLRSVTMYKSFPVTLMLTHGLRLYRMPSLNKRLAYAVPLFLTLWGAGAMSLQMREIARGRDPRDMSDWHFWASAMTRGGGLGILGDFFGAAVARNDQELTGVMMGPAFGAASDVTRWLGRNAYAEAEGYKSNFPGGFVGMLQRYQPGSNLWWARTAVDRLFWSQLRLAVDPSAPKAFARMERAAQRDYGQRFWARPGEMTPDRGPDFTAIAGGSDK
ncbi:hypothetical protein [Magnetospirillum sulfuroxidans]|uniref:Phage protein n=1 Tax=Magnetospirillum sulfuroxidans TaxID=611300 RepID=A0ABS5I8S3_9PROT|nr:hypothetical protein [Magnetospirillum sulfuroxidans]MBR9970806.1 hypothetical protein [Magnetospirillum sulfuroxidans]